MNNLPLPRPKVAYSLLVRKGKQFPESNRSMVLADGATYFHDGACHPIRVDTYALQGVDYLYTNHLQLDRALARQGKAPYPTTYALPVLVRAYQTGMVLGFSGFTLPEKSYVIEGRGMTELLKALRVMKQLPTLIVDGGGSHGILGLSGVLARQFRIPSLGYVPFRGLSSMGPRTHLVAHKDTFKEREVLVGLTPDVLVCVGGGPGARRECEEAIKNNSVVLLLALQKYNFAEAVQYTYTASETLRRAFEDGRFILCNTIEQMEVGLREIVRLAQQISLLSRSMRLDKIALELA